jgi:uncharacterized membrane protein YkvA (DUF1232 family)
MADTEDFSSFNPEDLSQEEILTGDAPDGEQMELVKSKAILKMEQDAGVYEENPERLRLDEETVQKQLWEIVKKWSKRLGEKFVGALNFLWQAMTNPRTPYKAKLIAISALVYFISPFDIVPDFLPFGFTDDGAAIAAAVAAITVILVKHGIDLKKE